MNEFLTWDYLLSFAGCVTGTALITQFLKNVSFIQKIGAQFISYIIAMVILVVAQIATGTLNWQLIALDVFNAAVVSFASNGVYDTIDSLKNTVKKE